jgi:MFS transporter, FHS family, L-fucose permease
MGLVAERYSTALSYLVPMICFIDVAWYGWKGYKVKDTSLTNHLDHRT